jgi:hypothetical protein
MISEIWKLSPHDKEWSYPIDREKWNQDELKQSEISMRLNEIPLHTYRLEGTTTKVTRPIKKMLIEILGKPAVDANRFADLCRRITPLYESLEADVELVTRYFTTSALGRYGDNDSCFHEEGCNSGNGEALDSSPSIHVLRIHPCGAGVEKEQRRGSFGDARIIVQYEDEKTIHLFNKYTQNKFREVTTRIFVKAMEALAGVELVYVGPGDDTTIPVYLNHQSKVYRIKGPETFDHLCTDFSWYCTTCCSLFDPEDVLTDIDENTYIITCSSSCMQNYAQYQNYCDHCDNRFPERNMIFMEDGSYCETCYYDIFARCDHCHESRIVADFETAIDDRGRTLDICDWCARQECRACEGCCVLYIADALQAFKGEDYCNQCIESEGIIDCEDCGDLFKQTGTNGEGLCKECEHKFSLVLHPAPGKDENE